MIDADELLVPHERQSPCHSRYTCKGAAHARTLCETDDRNVLVCNVGLGEGILDQLQNMAAVMQRSVLGQESFTRRWVVGVTQVGENGYSGWGGAHVMSDQSHAQLVGASFES